MTRYDWDEIVAGLELATDGWGFESIRALADYLQIPYATVHAAVGRGDVPEWLTRPDGRRTRDTGITELRPINVDCKPTSWIGDRGGSERTVLFIADPHFGFRWSPEGLRPFHVRPFITALLRIAQAEGPDTVIWNGDVLDLADWSRFDTETELVGHLQLAGIELAWVLGQFRQHCNEQVVLEGNHEVRLRRALVRYMGAGHSLRPVYDLNGSPLLSIQRFLGLEALDTTWVGGYPHSHVRVGSTIFSHGDAVRSESGRTAALLARSAATSRFFGHVHRHELLRTYVDDLDREVWVGSPGCAADKRVTPGAGPGDNWQLGAFLVHLQDGEVSNVEHVAGSLDGPTWFRGRSYPPIDYVPDLIESIPDEYARWLR